MFLLYQTASGLLLALDIRLPASPWVGEGFLPNPTVLERLANSFVVFDSFSTENSEYAAMGSPVRVEQVTRRPQTGFIDLQVAQYFPQARGEAYRRLGLSSVNDPDLRREGYRRLADRIRDLHNRRHPDSPVAQVFIYRHTWPKSRQGFFHQWEKRDAQLVGHN